MTELRESLEQQTATAEVLQVINSSPGELQPVFEAILEKAHTHSGATRGVLYLFDGENFRGAAMQGVPQDWAEQMRRGFSVRQTSLFAPLLAGDPFVHISDMRLIDDAVYRAAAEHGARTNLLLPLRKDGALLAFAPNRRARDWGGRTEKWLRLGRSQRSLFGTMLPIPARDQLLQVDDPSYWTSFTNRGLSEEQMKRRANLYVEATNRDPRDSLGAGALPHVLRHHRAAALQGKPVADHRLRDQDQRRVVQLRGHQIQGDA